MYNVSELGEIVDQKWRWALSCEVLCLHTLNSKA